MVSASGEEGNTGHIDKKSSFGIAYVSKTNRRSRPTRGTFVPQGSIITIQNALARGLRRWLADFFLRFDR